MPAMIRGRIGLMGRLFVMVVLAVTALVCACKPKAGGGGGGSCTGSEASCADPAHALVCINGTLLNASCGGPQGCTSAGTEVTCDNDFAAVGDGCAELNDVSCSTDKKAELTCIKNHFALKAACKGPRGCAVNGRTVSCDNDYSDIGDVCDQEGDYSCSTDRKSDVRCKDGHFALESTCKGPTGCTIVQNGAETDIKCDHNVAAVADPCHADGELACTADRSMLLRCVGQKFANYNACRGPKACTTKAHPEKKTMEFDCDDAVAQPGDPCDTPSEVACTADGGESLICRGGTFAAAKACKKHQCKVVSDFSVSCK
jgi:hypothetical protein